MNLLLDTHVLLWALLAPDRLSARARDAMLGSPGRVWVSAASTWEVAIKQSTGKLDLPGPAPSWLPPRIEEAGFTLLPIDAATTLRVFGLPWHHRDPFDRLLVAQAAAGYTLVTADRRLAAYDVAVLWD